MRKYTIFTEQEFDEFNKFADKLQRKDLYFENDEFVRMSSTLKMMLENLKEYQNQRLKINKSSRESKKTAKTGTIQMRQHSPAHQIPIAPKDAEQPKNIHAKEIDRIIQNITHNPSRYKTNVINTSHEDYVNGHSHGLFTNIIQKSFTKSYLKQHPCACGKPSVERCHGSIVDGEDRPSLIRKALARVWPDTSKQIMTLDIVLAFLEEHKNTKFTFKCHDCHQKENEK
jgi:hypothetical protein